MNRNRIVTILLVIFSFFSFFFLFNYSKEDIFAQTSCPSNMDPNSEQCLDYLNQQVIKLNKDDAFIRKNLRNEEYQQLNLKEKISYIRGQINTAENNIKILEIKISAHNVEIILLQKEIEEKKENISVLGQEINVLEDSVNQRVFESYKYSFIRPIELFLDVKNFSSIIRKSKYLIITRSQDKQYLEKYSSKRMEISEEESILQEKKNETQKIRNEMDNEKTELAEEKEILQAAQAEQSTLLAESARREAEYKAQLKQISDATAEITKAISDLANYLYDTGQLGDGSQVWENSFIGKQGHTGCSFGSHLHFEIRNTNNSRVNPLNGYLTYNGGNLGRGKYMAPMKGSYLTGGYSSKHQAIDMVSLSDGNQNLERYAVPYGLCPIVDGILNERKAQGRADWNLAYLTGEGAIVRAISPGTVYYSQPTDQYGGRWALVVHDNGERSFYLHLQ
ncbi:MAG: hypothetical protein PHI80_01685 [Candidatus Dojkabacteria bacterium]|nr:hypothetical protein [Candidatus Dojkabacteria bacterium]